MEKELKIAIQNLKGLHARATATFVKTAEQFQSEIIVRNKDGLEVSGKSIMGTVNGLTPGRKATILKRCVGSQCSDAYINQEVIGEDVATTSDN